MKVATRIAAALLLSAVASAASATIVVNGSFELGPVPGAYATYFAGSSAITGWTIASGSVDYIGSYWNAADGSRSLDMAGNSAGTISQMLDTVAGAKYRLSFWISGNPDSPVQKSMLVSAGSLVNAGISYNPVSTPLDWKRVWVDFTAVSDQTLLSFQSTNTGPYGMALDNVSVSMVPEPAMWATMVSGFGLVGFGMRRRRPRHNSRLN